MDLFTRADLRVLLAERQPPCVSLFMPSHRGGAEQDPIRFRKLLRAAEDRLTTHSFRAAEARDLLAPARALLEDVSFWPSQSDGLAVFLAPDFLRTYRLPWAFAEQVEVGGLFHILPLLPLLSGDGKFYVLAVSQNGVRLFQGTRFTVSPVELRGVPRSLAEALRAHDRDEPLTFHTRPTSGGTWGAIFEGHGVGIDDHKGDLLRYFQSIDRGLRPVLREEQAPLVVAAVDYLLPIFRQASSYRYLLDRGIEGSPDRLSERELHGRAWALVGPVFQEARRKAVALYHQLEGTGRACSDPRWVVPAAYRGDVETVFVARGSHLGGVLSPGTNEVCLHDQPEAGDEDLLNGAVVHTLRHGHTAYALEPEEVPGGAALAGIFCLPLPKRGKHP